MKFTKMQGLGNDYIYIDCLQNELKNPKEAAIKLSDRHFGIGGDGIVLICPSDTADFRMRMFNADGSEAEMCGNAIRCVGKYVYDNGLTDNNTIRIETLAGIKELKLELSEGKVSLVRVDMGEPILNPKLIPVLSEKDIFLNESVEIKGNVYNVTCVSMGNPHGIIYVEDVNSFPVHEVGKIMETHPLFPKKINCEFVELIDRKNLKMRVWERGSGETLACGTGACAVLVSSVLNGLCDRLAVIGLLGGNLTVEWSKEDNHVYMTGPCEKVFEGDVVWQE